MSKQIIFSIGSIVLLLLAAGVCWWPLRKRAGALKWLLIALVPLLGLGLYWHWGSPRVLFTHWQKQAEHEQALRYLRQQKSPLDVVKQLEQHLQQQPNQPRGWYLLGNIYAKQNRFKAAYVAYQKAYHYDSTTLDYLLALCQIDLTLHQVLHAQHRQLLMKAQSKWPTNLSIISLLAFDAYAQKRYQQAVQLWKQILGKLPPEGKEAKQVLEMIAKAQAA